MDVEWYSGRIFQRVSFILFFLETDLFSALSSSINHGHVIMMTEWDILTTQIYICEVGPRIFEPLTLGTFGGLRCQDSTKAAIP